MGLECARLCPEGEVWAIEKNAAEADNARENARRLRVANYRLIEGRAPEALADWPAPDAVFIGGSGGELPELIALSRSQPGSIGIGTSGVFSSGVNFAPRLLISAMLSSCVISVPALA